MTLREDQFDLGSRLNSFTVGNGEDASGIYFPKGKSTLRARWYGPKKSSPISIMKRFNPSVHEKGGGDPDKSEVLKTKVSIHQQELLAQILIDNFIFQICSQQHLET